MTAPTAHPPLDVFIIAGEESGDQLAARLMDALIRRTGGAIRFAGVGGTRMQALGLSSLFPIHDIAVMGVTAVIGRLPTLLKRIRQTAAAVVETRPDVLVIVDSPDFTHRVAKRVRKALPDLPVVAYVSPTVWAWRPGRARKMAAYVDQLLAILPFEPAVHARLGGPPTTYVGHPLTDRPDLLLPAQEERSAPGDGRVPVLLLLPGSRAGEVHRCLPDLAAAAAQLHASGVAFAPVIPAVPHLEDSIRKATADWPVPPRICRGEAEKFAAFRSARAALAVSGTVTLELALSGVPMAVVYRRDRLFRLVTEVIRRIPGSVGVSSMVLPNIILGENLVPEYLDEGIDPATLAEKAAQLLGSSLERRAQVAGFRRLWDIIRVPGAPPAAEAAASVVLRAAERSEAGEDA